MDYYGGFDINNQGVVVGVRSIDDHESTYIWSATQGMTDLGIYMTPNHSINDRGEVAGRVRDASDSESHLYLWSIENGLESPGDFGATHTFPAAINNRGQVVGSLKCEREGAPAEVQPFIWDATQGLQNIVLPRGYESAAAVDIDDRGLALVWTMQNEEGKSSFGAFLWSEEEGMKRIDSIDREEMGTIPVALNGRGQIAGFFRKDNTPNVSFLWHDEDLIDLGLLEGALDLMPFDLNDRSQIVGMAQMSFRQSFDDFFIDYRSRIPRSLRDWVAKFVDGKWPKREPFIWENGKMENLNDLVGGELDAKLEMVHAINDRGQIVASGLPYGPWYEGRWVTYLLTPVETE